MPGRLRAATSLDRGDPAVDRDQQPGAAAASRSTAAVGEAVALVEAARQLPGRVARRARAGRGRASRSSRRRRRRSRRTPRSASPAARGRGSARRRPRCRAAPSGSWRSLGREEPARLLGVRRSRAGRGSRPTVRETPRSPARRTATARRRARRSSRSASGIRPILGAEADGTGAAQAAAEMPLRVRG